MTQQWKLVPVEPTEEQVKACSHDDHGGLVTAWYRRAIYAAMLAAAPTPPASAQDDAKDELTRERIEGIAREVYKVERFTKDDEVWHNLHWLTSFAKAIEKELRRPAPAAGNARDAARYRALRRKVCIAGGKFHILNLDPTYVAPDAAVELDSVLDDIAASQQQEG